MRKMVWMIVCLLSTTMACGQTAKEAFDAFRDFVVNKQFVLRNFSGEPKVRGAWAGTELQMEAPRWSTFAALKVESAEMHGQKIELSCQRRVLGRDEQNKIVAFAVTEPVMISIDLSGAEPRQAFSGLRVQLFYTSLADALGAIPKPLKSEVPRRIGPRPKDAISAGTCDCVQRETDACPQGARWTEFTRPKLTHQIDPELSGAPRGLNGNVFVSFIVDDTGLPKDLWVTQPFATGADDAVATAVLKEDFQPATCHGQPVGTPLRMEVNVQTF